MLTVEGDWKQGARLREFAAGHPGTYIVFTTDSGLSILKKPKSLSKALALYDEFARLGKEQEQREAKQAPLAKRQQELSD